MNLSTFPPGPGKMIILNSQRVAIKFAAEMCSVGVGYLFLITQKCGGGRGESAVTNLGQLEKFRWDGTGNILLILQRIRKVKKGFHSSAQSTFERPLNMF